jgi:hypothetical protein
VIENSISKLSISLPNLKTLDVKIENGFGEINYHQGIMPMDISYLYSGISCLGVYRVILKTC